MESEKLLIKESIQGSDQAFAEIVHNYKNYVFAIVLNFIKDYGEAENVAQEVFLQIYIALPSYSSENFKGWIGKIAANKSIDWIRKKKSKFNEKVIEDAGSIIDMKDIQSKDNPESFIIDNERKELLINALSSIPEIYRTVVEKFYFEEKSYEEIALEENAPVKTIASRLYRAKLLLKTKWREENEAL